MTGGAAKGAENSVIMRAFRNEQLLIACYAIVLFLALMQALTFYALPGANGGQDPTDYVSFFVSGRLFWQGHAADAYDKLLYTQHLKSIGQIGAYLSWAYPPQFFFLLAIFAPLPIWLGYLAFTLSGFAAFAHVLKRLAGAYAPGAFAIALPAIIITTRSGQTGFWIAALIGWFLLAYRDGRDRAGIPLGLMVIKPHLAAGIGVLTLISRRWRVALLAGAIIAASSLLATLALGPGIWSSFRTGVAGSSNLLWHGNLPLSRMTSVFAFAYRIGSDPRTALICHAAVAAGGIAWLMWIGRSAKREHVLAWTVFSGLLVSPYNYDYDLVALALAAGLILPELAQKARSWEIAGMALLASFASANSQIMVAQMLAYGHIFTNHGKVVLASFSAPALLLLAGWVGLAVSRRAGGVGAVSSNN